MRISSFNVGLKNLSKMIFNILESYIFLTHPSVLLIFLLNLQVRNFHMFRGHLCSLML
jgi:hypothetical protein